jgi:aryl-alcohol dehydrogenase
MGGNAGSALAAVLEERDGRFQLEEVEVDRPRADEVLVRIVASGVCHTDVISRAGWGDTPFPIVLGHEGSGVVEEVGAAVRKVRPGDRVVTTFISCGCCPSCFAGEPASCRHLDAENLRGTRTDGSSPVRRAGRDLHARFIGQSSFATRAVVHERSVVKVTTDLDLTLVGPLGCGISTGAGAVLNVARPDAGSTVAVFGVGAVGMSAVMAAAAVGCTTIVAVDPDRGRRQFALEVGATHAVDSGGDDAADAVRTITKGGADFAIEAAGIPDAVHQAVAAMRNGGTCVYLGNHPEGSRASFDLNQLSTDSKIRGSSLGGGSPDNLIPALLRLHERGMFPFDRMIEKHPFADINEVLDAGGGAGLKPVLVMDPPRTD